MAIKTRKLILGFLCLLLFLVPSSSLQDKLVQGQEVKDKEVLVSAQGKFKLGFFNLTSNNYYLGIMYNNSQEEVVWIANLDTPIFHNSGSLTIDDIGNLKISDNSGLSIVLYSGQEGSNNTSAVLLDNGNFVLRELSPEGVVKRELWQSFDHPTNTLLPGMKLGVDHKTGQTWSLRSGRSYLNPDIRSFTFGLDPNHTNQLVILFHGELYWTSGSWYKGYFNSSSGLKDSYWNFSYIANENETYFNYSVEKDVATSPLCPMLLIDYLGRLWDDNYIYVDCTSAPSSLTDGCVTQKLPECRSPSDTFSQNSSFWDESNGFKFNESDNLIMQDCKAKCMNNCSCVAYAVTNEYYQTGCEIWSTRPRFDGSSLHRRNIYFLESESKTTYSFMLMNLSHLMHSSHLPRFQFQSMLYQLQYINIMFRFFIFLFFKFSSLNKQKKKKKKKVIKL
jgi:hypothetical protein